MSDIQFSVNINNVDNSAFLVLLDAIRNVQSGRRANDYAEPSAPKVEHKAKSIADEAMELGTEATAHKSPDELKLEDLKRKEADEQKELAPPPPPPPASVDTTTGEIELDTPGYPWDERIHRTTRKQAAKGGAWLLKRSVDSGLVAQVHAEYRAAGYGVPQTETTAPDANDVFGR